MSKLTLIILLMFMSFNFSANAKNDTTYLYFSKSWETCNADTAYYTSKTWKENKKWFRKDFYNKTNSVQMEGSYQERECKTRQGNFSWYRENGSIKETAVFDNGKRTVADFYYESGKKKAKIEMSGDITKQKGWTENGEEIPDYIAEQEAKFAGGNKGWVQYLQRNLNANVAADAGAKTGTYTVKIRFKVDKEGYISDVVPTEVPAKCRPCAIEAIRVIEKGPKWEPAIQFNQLVDYMANQAISFQVSEN